MPLTEADLALRRTLLSGTDMVAIFCDPVCADGRTEHDVYLSKVGEESASEPTEAMQVGHEMEPGIVRMLAKKHSLALAYPCPSMRHPRHEWVGCTPDAMVLHAPGRVGIVGPFGKTPPDCGTAIGICDAKAVGVHMMEHWHEPEVPGHVLVQLLWGAFVTGVDTMFVAALLGTEVKTFRIDIGADEREAIQALREAGEKWWRDHVIAKKRPEIDQSEGASRMVRALVGKKHNGAIIQAGPEAEHAARMYAEASAQIKEAEARKREASTRLIEIIADNDGVQGVGWRARHTSRRGYMVPSYEVKEGRTFDLRRRKEPKKVEGRNHDASCMHGDCWCKPGSDGT
jgi:predicted phage-related endonuclease